MPEDSSYPTIIDILNDFVKFIKEDNPKPYDWFEGNIHFYLDMVLERYLNLQTKNNSVFTKITSNIGAFNLNLSSPTKKKPHCYGKPNELCSASHPETDEDCEFLDECMQIFQENFKKPDFDDTGLDGCESGRSIRE